MNDYLVKIVQNNIIAIFKLIGTYKDFRRRGLGKLVILEGLKRLKSIAKKTHVKTSCKNKAA